MTPPITIFTKDYCPYCKAAKAILTAKGVKFTNYEISIDPDKRQEMIQKANGRTTVPQIFAGEFHIGGYTDLEALNAAGGLDAILRSASPA